MRYRVVKMTDSSILPSKHHFSTFSDGNTSTFILRSIAKTYYNEQNEMEILLVPYLDLLCHLSGLR